LRSASLEVGGKKLVASNLHPPTSPQKTEKLQTKTLKSLLELSIEFEKDTILFCQMLRSFIDDREVLNGLDKIIEEESRHVDELSLSLIPTSR
jgi:rubrerythrin